MGSKYKKKKTRGALSEEHVTQSRGHEFKPHAGCRIKNLKRKNEKRYGLFGKFRKYPRAVTDLENAEAVLTSFTCSCKQSHDSLNDGEPRKVVLRKLAMVAVSRILGMESREQERQKLVRRPTIAMHQIHGVQWKMTQSPGLPKHAALFHRQLLL